MREKRSSHANNTTGPSICSSPTWSCPTMNGRDLAKRLLTLRPQMPVALHVRLLGPDILKEVMGRRLAVPA